jgi:DNA polymerase V
MYALVDCNNFYASCERLFRPDLRCAPIIVLSNNDGCVVARSNEAKALGIKMGVPYFEVKPICKEYKVQVFSSNYTLYGDLSARVMSVIQDVWDASEIYSIDEAFLNLKTLPAKQLESFCADLHKKILKYTGIPTTIGIGPTKTLAKAANHIAKKKLKIAVFNITDERKWLAAIEVQEIWGIGRQWGKRLNALGIQTAEELAKLNLRMLKKTFNVVLQRTAMELNGIPCFDLEIPEPKKSIISSCSFGGLQTDFRVLQEGISHHCATAWTKMRRQGLIAQHLSVFVRSNPFRQDLPQYANTMGFRLINATDDIRYLTRCAKFCLNALFKQGIHYHKSGVILGDLIERRFRQTDLFHQPSTESLEHTEKILDVMDLINTKYGERTIRLAAEGFQKTWSMKRQLKTPNYTTRWSELPIVYAR